MTEISSSDGSDYYDFTPSKKTYTEADEAALRWRHERRQRRRMMAMTMTISNPFILFLVELRACDLQKINPG